MPDPIVRQALVEAAMTFGHNLNRELDASGFARAAALLEDTLVSGLRDRGYTWEEPLRGFVLKAIVLIARAVNRHPGDGLTDGDIVGQAFEDVQTRILDRLEDVQFCICLRTIHPTAPPELQDRLNAREDVLADDLGLLP